MSAVSIRDFISVNHMSCLIFPSTSHLNIQIVCQVLYFSLCNGDEISGALTLVDLSRPDDFVIRVLDEFVPVS